MKIIKENGVIWGEEIQDLEGRHKKLIWLGTYDDKPNETPKKKIKKIKKGED